MGRQERRLPPPLPRRLHSPPLSQRHHRHQHSHLHKLLQHPSATQRRSPRPHAHHTPSSAQPPSRPPRGGDIFTRSTLRCSLLPLLLYTTSSAAPASAASASSSSFHLPPPLLAPSPTSPTPLEDSAAMIHRSSASASWRKQRLHSTLLCTSPSPSPSSSFLVLTFSSSSLLIPFFYHLPPVVRRPHSAVSCSSAWEAPATWMQRKVSASCRAGASSRPCHLPPVIHCFEDGITLRSDRTYSCLRSLRHVGIGHSHQSLLLGRSRALFGASEAAPLCPLCSGAQHGGSGRRLACAGLPRPIGCHTGDAASSKDSSQRWCSATHIRPAPINPTRSHTTSLSSSSPLHSSTATPPPLEPLPSSPLSCYPLCPITAPQP